MQVIRDRVNADFLEHRLREALETLTGKLDEPTYDAMRPFFELSDLSGGASLVRQGDAGDSMFVLLSGRLQVQRIKSGTGQHQNLGEITPGETVGEMALITKEPRSADIIAMRDCVVARLGESDFEYLMETYPKALMNLSKAVINRFRRASSLKNARKRLTNICLLPISNSVDLAHFSSRLELALSAHGSVLMLTSELVNDQFQSEDMAQVSRTKSSAHRQVSHWLEAQEARYRFVLYIPDLEDTEWTKRCLRQADEILLIADAHADSTPQTFEKKLLHSGKKRTFAGQTLVLIHPSETAMPLRTEEWISHRTLTLHHHLRQNHAPDFARLARFMNGSAVGLVLSGGGAKGFAHIGVFRALQEAGVPIDLVGGTSIGGIMGALVARGWSGHTLRKECKRVFGKNPTSDFNFVPRVSVFKGKKLNSLLAETFSDLRIEDLWLNFYCVSCNLTRTQPHIHKSGLLRDALRASISIPGIFPPAELNDDLFVDGGVFNNMPVDIMIQQGAGMIVAVDLQVHRNTDAKKEDKHAPNLIFVVMESSMLSGRFMAQEYRSAVDWYFNPPLSGISLIDWQKFDQIEEIGYEHGKEVLKAGGLLK